MARPYDVSGPVSRPVDELVKYAQVLEAIVDTLMVPNWFSGRARSELHDAICPHWKDVLEKEDD